jgi:glycosyltransferase involved in cell wall biosynthesis
MRVLIDLSSIRNGLHNGTALYVYHLAEALLQLGEQNLIVYFGARESPAATKALARLEQLGASVVIGPAPWRWSPDGGWWLPTPPSFQRLLRTVDVFHAGEFFFPRISHARVVATVHDLTNLSHPEYHIRWNRWLHGKRLRWIERRADRVIASSASTRRDLLQYTRVPAERVDCIHLARAHGMQPEADSGSLARFGLDGRRYILSVGTLEPRKNHRRLIEAFASLPAACADTQLVLAGGPGWKMTEIQETMASSPARDRIHSIGHVSAADLQALYAGATIFAYPSLYEGFGIPLLEAMAAGAPILTSNVSSLPEVAGNAALLVDPLCVRSIRDGLHRLLSDSRLRQELVARGRAREKEFTWARTARETVAVYHRALEQESPSQLARAQTHR